MTESALQLIGMVYEVEREVQNLTPDEQQRIRPARSRPLLDALHQWMLLTRQKITDGSATAKALDYSLKRWVALTRFMDDGRLPVVNNWIENQIRPIAIGRSNWLFANSLRAGKRAAAVTSLICSAKLNGHDPYAYLKDVLTRRRQSGPVRSGSIGKDPSQRFAGNAVRFAQGGQFGELLHCEIAQVNQVIALVLGGGQVRGVGMQINKPELHCAGLLRRVVCVNRGL